ncbi:hypothetical protein BJY04DRAFT_219686 [Aspergillus karnatakaensis]|uniref:uncharacterized protein n=1 Tax=Aspergillus karnatakaensis TaxID=1810916 RepID=UPI003CCCC90B
MFHGEYEYDRESYLYSHTTLPEDDPSSLLLAGDHSLMAARDLSSMTHTPGLNLCDFAQTSEGDNTPFPVADFAFDDASWFDLPQSQYQPGDESPLAIPSPAQSTPNSDRGLPRRRSQYLVQRSANGSTPPIVIPNAAAPDPMQRWRESPPEDEPAAISAILNAMRTIPIQQESPSASGSAQGPDANSSFVQYRAPSITSGESSASSRESLWSSGSLSSTQAGTAKKRLKASRRAEKPPQKRQTRVKADRRFCCTFCCDRFRTKYDWARHEKSLHLSLEQWECAPNGTVVVSETGGQTHCAFCSAIDPSAEHLSSHNHYSCRTDSGPRGFRRKDHLVQHLRTFHHLDTLPVIDDWRAKNKPVTSRCGFCDQSLNSWEQRADHLASHFRQGTTMKEWTGDHGFPPEIAPSIMNSLPPYLIWTESLSSIPFSATNTQVQDHFHQISARARCQNGQAQQQNPSEGLAPEDPPIETVSMKQLTSFTEVLTLHLSRYAREQVENGVIPTDAMFQDEARRVVYDSTDSWNQTMADNDEWLSRFRQLHCEGRPSVAEPSTALQ